MAHNIPRKIKFKILEHAEINDINNLCLMTKDWFNFCNNDSLWINEIPADYFDFTRTTKPKNMNLLAWYRTLYSYDVFPLTENGSKILVACHHTQQYKIV